MYAPAAGTGGGASFEDYLAFRAFFTGSAAIAVFWVAEGANAVFWLLNWFNYRFTPVPSFLWSLAGFIVGAVVIRIAVEAAVNAIRAREELAALRREAGGD